MGSIGARAQTWMRNRKRYLRVAGVAGILLTVAILSSGCMKLHIEAREGSTVNITESGNKRVVVTTDASIPASALGL